MKKPGPKPKEFNCRKCGDLFFRNLSKSRLNCEKCRYQQNIPFHERDRRSQKRLLLKERGHECERCKTKQWMGTPVPLQLDHIDGNSGNGLKENLRLLCPNCHSQTPTYAGRNVGKAKNVNRKTGRAKYYKYVNDSNGS